MSFYDDASLVVIPSAQKTSKLYSVKPTDGSGDLAFTRTGDTATRVNSAGLIEKVRTNLLTNSEEFTTANGWFAGVTGGSTATQTSNYGIALNGTTTADRIQLALNSQAYADWVRPVSGFVVGQSYTYSIYLKSLTASTTLEIFNDGSGGILKTITTEWARYSHSFIAASSTIYPRFLLQGATSTTADLLAWGYQLETGDIATAYIPTLTAAVSTGPTANVPRLDYLGSTCPRLLLEPQRTNLVTYSEQLDNAAWTKSDVTITANATTSPDGYTNADLITASAGTAFKYAFATIGATTGNLSVSFFVKRNTAQFVQILMSGISPYANYDLTNKTSQSFNGANSLVQDYGNGWLRIVLILNAASATDGAFITFTDSLSGGRAASVSTTNSFYAWGAQLEAGAYATSYIPTLAASATRGADYAAKTSASALIGQSEGVVFVDFEVTDPANFQSINVYNNNKAGNTISTVTIQFNLTQVIASIFYGNGTFDTITLNATGYGLNQRLKVAFRYKSGDLALYVNGVQKDTDATTYTAIGTKSEVFLGDPTVYFAYKGGLKINNYLQFTSALTNAQLAELTTL